MNTTSKQLDELRQIAESLQVQAEINALEKQIRAAEQNSNLVEGEWGELINRRDYLYDTPGFGHGQDFRISQPSDRHKGKNFPFFETETDLANIRGIARHIAGTYEIAVCAMENLTSYSMGTGFDYQFKEKKDIEAPEGLVKIIETVFDEWKELNKWCGQKEIEAFQATHRDGELFLWSKETPAGPKVRIVEPSFITEPANYRAVEDYIGEVGLCWSFGVATPDDIHTDETIGYFYLPYMAGDNWEWIEAKDMTHVKLNVDSVVKRGMSDFYAVYQDLERAAKVFENTAQGTAIQAAIAYIKEHVAGTSGEAISLGRNARANSSMTVQTSLGQRTSYTEKMRSGKIVETVGTKYHAGPLGDNNAESYLAVGQAMLRMVGARWQMPEYMISGDASNANYSSTLVSGGPFDKATQRRQARFVHAYSEIIWKALDSYARRGRFKEFGITSAMELKQLVTLNIVPEPPSVQDKKEQFEIDKGLVDSGVMSKRTLAGRYSLDYDSEMDSIEDEQPEQPEYDEFGMPVIQEAVRKPMAKKPKTVAKDGDGDGKVNDGKPNETAVSKQAETKVNPKVLAWAKKKFGDDTKAQAFANWFGDSKVVDENGDPLVVYHGSPKDFDEFSVTAHGSSTDFGWYGQGHYFTTSRDTAKSYTRSAGGKDPMELYIHSKNPLIIPADYGMTDGPIANVFREIMPPEHVDYYIKNKSESPSIPTLVKEVGADKFSKAVRKMGYDGILKIQSKEIVGEDSQEWIAFSPTQIKSATGNKGTFDPKNPKITESALEEAARLLWGDYCGGSPSA